MIAVAGTSVAFTSAIPPGPAAIYLFTCSVNCWIAQGAAPVASAATGSFYVLAGTVMPINGLGGAHLAVIQDAAAGKACLARASTF